MICKKILLATDFSDQAKSLINYVKELKLTGLQEVVLVHVVDTEGLKFDFLDSTNNDNEKEKQEYKTQLMKEKNKIENLGLNVKDFLLTGSPANKIVQTANSEDVDLILIACHGKGYFKELLLGSTTLNVIKASQVPILVKKYKENDGESVEVSSKNKFRKVLIPTDFSQLSIQLFDKIKKFNEHIKEVVILYVIEQNFAQERLKRFKLNIKEKLDQLKAHLEENVVSVKTEIRIGKASQNILKVAKEKDVSLIMMPTRGAGTIKGFIIGSTTNTVIRNSKRSVMVFPSADLLALQLGKEDQSKLIKKTNKLVSELMSFYFESGIEQVKVDVRNKCTESAICIQGSTKAISSYEVEKLRKSLNTPRETQVEDYYWELVGESNRSSELSLIGMMTDKAEVEYENGTLKITVYMKK